MTKFANSITSAPVFKIGERKLVLVAVVGMLGAFAVLLIFVGIRVVRHVPIYWKEKVEATVTFKTIEGQLKIVGTKGNGQVNPTLISRTGDTAYILTVINKDTSPHMFYIDGLNIHTKLLRAGQNDSIIIYSKREGTYNYYDRVAISENQQQAAKIEPLGQFKALKVAGDE